MDCYITVSSDATVPIGLKLLHPTRKIPDMPARVGDGACSEICRFTLKAVICLIY